MDHPARSPMAPRLVLIVAVLACLFGWGHSVASAASAAEGVAPPVVAADQTVSDAGHGHAAAGHAAAGHAATGHAEADGPGEGDAGHDPGHEHEHSVSCMASSPTVAFGAMAAPDAATSVIAAVSPQPRLLPAAVPVEAHRAPSIATLCVLRT